MPSGGLDECRPEGLSLDDALWAVGCGLWLWLPPSDVHPQRKWLDAVPSVSVDYCLSSWSPLTRFKSLACVLNGAVERGAVVPLVTQVRLDWAIVPIPKSRQPLPNQT